MKGLYLEDEAFVSEWKNTGDGIFPVFPGVDLRNFESLDACLFQSYGGHIPVMHIKDRKEFEKLICQIFYKGEKRQIPASMGALAVKGWKDTSGQVHRAIILSDGYYSAVEPEDIGLAPEDWKAKSLILRQAHECTHYYTLRAFGFMNNDIRDEIIADAMGIIEAFGEYRADLFLKFMGLENYPEYRSGGRLQNYLPKDRAIPEKEFAQLQKRAYDTSKKLEVFLKNNQEYLENEESKLRLLNILAGTKEIIA